MNLKSLITYVRLAAFAAPTVLAAAQASYPHETWITGIIGVLSYLGVHNVDSVRQSKQQPPSA